MTATRVLQPAAASPVRRRCARSRPSAIALALALALAHAADARAQKVPAAAMASGAEMLSRPARLTLRDVPLASGLAALQRAAGITLAFSPSFLPDDRLVTCSCSTVTVAQAFDSLLAGTGLRYAVMNGQLIVERDAAPAIADAGRARGDVPPAWLPAALPGSAADRYAAAPARRRVAGTVVAAHTGQPLAHGVIEIEGTGLRTTTDAAGEFVFDDVPGEAVRLRTRLIGYRERVRAVAVGETGVRIELPVDALELDGIVVTGTAGTARAREVGNSIGQIDMRDVAEAARGLESLLQARVPGVNITMGSGTLGAGAAIRLRGNVSVSQSNQPLIYIDGVRQTTEAYPRNMSANGPTHRGNNVQASLLGDIDIADVEHIEILKGAAAATLYGTEAAAGVIQIFTKKGVPGAPSWSYQLDHNLTWIAPFGSEQRPLLRMDPWLRTGRGQKHSVSVRGGDAAAQYFVSGGHVRGSGVLPGEEETRYSARANLSLRASGSLSLDLRAFLTRHDLSNVPSGNTDDGLLWNVYRAPNGLVQMNEIDRLLDAEIRSVSTRHVLGATAHWTPVPGFSNRLTIGLDHARSHNTQFRPHGYIVQPEGDVTDVFWDSHTFTVDHVSTVAFDLAARLRASISAGGQLIQSSESTLDGYGRGLPGPGRHTLASTALRAVTQEQLRFDNGGFFVHGLLDVADRYFLTLGLRVDGSSAFGRDFGLQPYPKVSASYVLSDEPFWRDGWGQVKLRAAYGFAGRAPGAFDAVRTWRAASFLNETGFVPDNVGNAALGPERTAELEAGLDGSFLDDRLSVNFTAYHQKTTDALFPVATPASLGFIGQQLANVGALTNRGIELGVRAKLIDTPALAWDVGATVATNRSELTALGAATSYNLVVGLPVPVIRGTRVVNATAFADPIYEEDAYFGPNQPTRLIGLNTTLGLPGRVTVALRGDYQGGHHTFDYPSTIAARTGAGAVACDDVYALVPWSEYRGPGDAHPRLGEVRALDRARCFARLDADAWVFPADFFKLREVTVRAPLPFALPGGAAAVMTASFRNVWRWVNGEFASFDPEIIGARDQVSAFVFGTLDQLPPPASAVFSLRVGF